MLIRGDQVPGIERLVTMRAWAVLLAQNAYDVTPLEVHCEEFDSVTLYICYTRGAAAGGVTLRIEGSPYTADAIAAVNTAAWFRVSQYAGAILAAGADSAARFQRESLTYQATGATQESWVYGPIALGRTCERMRVACAEVGAGAVGSCAIVALFS